MRNYFLLALALFLLDSPATAEAADVHLGMSREALQEAIPKVKWRNKAVWGSVS